MSFMTEKVAGQIPTVLSMLIIICVVGSIGNLLVIIVYTLKHDKLTANVFILALAISDFLCCLTLIPFTGFVEYIDWKIHSNILCKSYYFFNTIFIPFSSLLISCIAFDRYFCLCHPFLRIMTIERAKKLVALLVLVSVTMGTSSTFTVRVVLHKNVTGNHTDELGVTDDPNADLQHSIVNTTSLGLYECTETVVAEHTLAEYVVYHIVQKCQTVFFIFCIISVIVLYILIYRTVSKTMKKRKTLRGSRSKSKPPIVSPIQPTTYGRTNTPTIRLDSLTTCPNNQAKEQNASVLCLIDPTNRNQLDQKQQSSALQVSDRDKRLNDQNYICSEPTGNGGKLSENSENSIPDNNSAVQIGFSSPNLPTIQIADTVRVDRRSLKSGKNLTDTTTFQNLKTAAMLFVVALCYIVTMLPAMLMMHGIIPLYLPIFYLYYVNNAINPIVYGFMNPNFRHDIHLLFCSRKCTR